MSELLAELLREGYQVHLDPVPDEDFTIQATVLQRGIVEAKVWGTDLEATIERAYLETPRRHGTPATEGKS